MKIALIDYGAGNPLSVQLAFERLGQRCKVTANATEILSADKIIIPGAGNAESAMNSLRTSGLVPILTGTKKPVLGICLGMQLFFASSDEGGVDCLQILSGTVGRFTPPKKVPHVGWNDVTSVPNSRLLRGMESPFFYFVHSFKADTVEGVDCVASTTYGNETFVALVEKNNFFGVQFHPERSGTAGEQLLQNFLEI